MIAMPFVVCVIAAAAASAAAAEFAPSGPHSAAVPVRRQRRSSDEHRVTNLDVDVDESATKQGVQAAAIDPADHTSPRAKKGATSDQLVPPAAALEGGRHSLDEDSLQISQLKSYRLGSISIVTVETRSGAVDLPGLPGKVENPAEGQGESWQGPKTKNKMLLRWLEVAVSRSPDDLAVLVDSDVTFGGCSEADLLNGYKTISQASGGTPIVSSAEMGLFPWTKTVAPQYESQQLRDRLHRVLKEHHLQDGWAAPYVDCRENHVGPCRNHVLDALGHVKLALTPSRLQQVSYQYLNYGFTMGPVSNLLKMVQYIDENGQEGDKINSNDQGAAASFMLSHPELVSLDYTGTLCLSLHNFDRDKFFTDVERGIPGIIEVRNADGHTTIYNRVAGKTQCFMHGNGGGKTLHLRLAKLLRGNSSK